MAAMTGVELLHECVSEGAAATEELGARLGRRLRSGCGIGLRGELGAGKTVFVRGLARGLAVEAPDEVRSPTYLLMVEHPGPVPLLHVDAYFAGRSTDLLADGGMSYLLEGGVLAIEWLDRIGFELPPDFLCIEIEHRELETRRLRFFGLRRVWGETLAALVDHENGAEA